MKLPVFSVFAERNNVGLQVALGGACRYHAWKDVNRKGSRVNRTLPVEVTIDSNLVPVMVLLSPSSSSNHGPGALPPSGLEPEFPEEDEPLKPESLRMLLHSGGGAEERMGSLCKPGVFTQEATCASLLSFGKKKKQHQKHTSRKIFTYSIRNRSSNWES